ncbi:MAG: N-acetyl-gamma-glutamyl-phosphate reductase [candidate division KSB1 bacterium]|nr:N-acetyl-gamma-glutamyl-phosphate reductase [candidate division KSB1 bacterium]
MKVGIVGAVGYTGEELIKTLERHRKAELVFATSEREHGKPLSAIFPFLRRYGDLRLVTAEEATALPVDLVFLCLHAGESAGWAARLLERGAKVIDLGADFRFRSAADYETWYQAAHPKPELLQEAVYGLPEWHRQEIRTARLVGNPGCYPTSVLLALLPFVQEKLLSGRPVIVDAKSGVSGAGKKPSDTTHFVSVNENLSPYKVGRVHRHVGEMEKELAAFGAPQKIVFTPHLTPVTRGMLSTIYVELNRDFSLNDILQLWRQRYADEPFVRVLDGSLPTMSTAQHTNFCFLGAVTVPETRTAILFSAIDNLGKGASTQAVQNMNLMLGFEESEGLY